MLETACTHLPASFSFSFLHRRLGIVMSPFVDCRLPIKTMQLPCVALPWNVGRSLRNCDASSKQNWDQIRGKDHSKNANISIMYLLTISVPLTATQRFGFTVCIAPNINALFTVVRRSLTNSCCLIRPLRRIGKYSRGDEQAQWHQSKHI